MIDKSEQKVSNQSFGGSISKGVEIGKGNDVRDTAEAGAQHSTREEEEDEEMKEEEWNEEYGFGQKASWRAKDSMMTMGRFASRQPPLAVAIVLSPHRTRNKALKCALALISQTSQSWPYKFLHRFALYSLLRETIPLQN